MRIGEFAEKYSVSKDTVHFYIREGYLAPEKKGQYDFDWRCCQDMQLLMIMKEYGISLTDIGRLLVIGRMEGYHSADFQKYRSNLLQARLDELKEEQFSWNKLSL